MDSIEFIKANFGEGDTELYLSRHFSRKQLAELIDEFNEVHTHIKYSKLPMDGTKPTIEEWITYNQEYKAWKARHPDLTTMEAAMSEPNKPGYYRANND